MSLPLTINKPRPCTATQDMGGTYAILRLCALLKPAKEALRPTSPTAPVSPGDRNRNLTDMAVTCKERTGESAWHHHPASAVHRGQVHAATPLLTWGPLPGKTSSIEPHLRSIYYCISWQICAASTSLLPYIPHPTAPHVLYTGKLGNKESGSGFKSQLCHSGSGPQ
nr:uncharacterized protein LOC103244404 isoform X2 [Chlorocebus sabaeus]